MLAAPESEPLGCKVILWVYVPAALLSCSVSTTKLGLLGWSF